MSEFDLGKAQVFPSTSFVAGTFATITYEYTAGHPLDYAGYIKITFRNMDDFGTPQFDDPTAPNFCSVSTSGGSSIIPRWDRKGAERPSNKAIYLQIRDEFVNTGDVITIVFGDRSLGSPGWQLPTYITDQFEFTTYVDPIATYIFKKLPVSPSVALVPGRVARGVCTAPSELTVDQDFDASYRLEDRWGNPIDKPTIISQPGYPKAGVFTVQVKDDKHGFSTTSNPIDVHEKEPSLKKYWADFHGQSGETIGSNTINDYFSFGRDVGRLDILGHQGNDFQVTDAFWEKVNQVTLEFYKPGKFVTFPGFEWSGNTPVGGDRNVFFATEGGNIARSSLEQVPGNTSNFTPSYTAKDLFKDLQGQKDLNPFVFAHIGGRYADLSMHDPEIETAIEVHSVWGTFEWFIKDALERGYRVGFVANSDGHKCDPGAAYPGNSKFSTPGGLTCVLAETLDRESVFKAIKARHCYATSNARILMDLHIDVDGHSAIMGDIVDVQNDSQAVLDVRLIGTSPIQCVDIFNGSQLTATKRPYTVNDLGNRYKLVWNGARVRGQDRVLRWDGGLSIDGNSIINSVPINFWNPDHPLVQDGTDVLSWQSFTTGTAKGVILTLGKPAQGTIHFNTQVAKMDIDLSDIDIESVVWEFGELEKSVRIARLPDNNDTVSYSFRMPIENLKNGDNPIFIRITQEDGQKAWSSPVYLVK